MYTLQNYYLNQINTLSLCTITLSAVRKVKISFLSKCEGSSIKLSTQFTTMTITFWELTHLMTEKFINLDNIFLLFQHGAHGKGCYPFFFWSIFLIFLKWDCIVLVFLHMKCVYQIQHLLCCQQWQNYISF